MELAHFDEQSYLLKLQTQMGFFHGRFILNNVFLAFEAME
jgi:hypothetical protein